MKKNLAKNVTLSILAGAVLMSSSAVWAMSNTGSGSDSGSAPKYWEDRSHLGYVRISEDNEFGDVSLVIDDYDYLDSAEAFYGAVSFEEGTTAANGKVTINDSIGDEYTFTGGIYGGAALIDGEDEPGSDANNNKVFITTSDATITGDVYGGYADDGNATGNSVTIEAGNFQGYISGGYAHGDAEGNNVTITGGTFSDYEMTGGYADDGNAEGNSVTITGGTFEGYLDGGCAYGGDAEGNSVTITGGTFLGEIVGASSYGGNVKENTITISGSANLAGASLIGGVSRPSPGEISMFAGGPPIGGGTGSGGEVSGNTLNIGINEALLDGLDPADEDGNRKYGLQVGAWSGEGTGKVKSIKGFDTINFANINWDTTKPVIEVDDLVLNNTEIKVGTVNVDGGTELANGDKMALISASDISGEISNNGEEVVINKGIAEQFNGFVEQNNTDKKIYLKLGDGPDEGYTVPGGSTRNDQVLVLGESRAAAVAFTNQGSELIETGLNALARDNEKDTKIFAAVYGNHSEYETGSHVNVNGWSGIVGIGKTNDDGLTVGAFFENGEGNYSTHNIFTNDYIRGDGEACYNGGGFLVRKDNANGFYAEASLRAGNLQNELRNAVRNGSELTGYDIDTFYYGAHVGIGKVIPRGNDGDSVDVYGKFIYTHHDGETFDIGGTATKFDSVESERLRLGFRINEVQTNKLSMYYGAAWEYEFNGDAHDKIASFDLETPSLEGSTVIGEIGAHYKASEKWSIDLNGRAYVGQREGFSGSVQANYNF